MMGKLDKELDIKYAPGGEPAVIMLIGLCGIFLCRAGELDEFSTMYEVYVGDTDTPLLPAYRIRGKKIEVV
jgi:hypothetical protein